MTLAIGWLTSLVLADEPAVSDRDDAYRVRSLSVQEHRVKPWSMNQPGILEVALDRDAYFWGVVRDGQVLRMPALADALGDVALVERFQRRDDAALGLAILGGACIGVGGTVALAQLTPLQGPVGTRGFLAVSGLVLADVGGLFVLVPVAMGKRRTWAGKFYDREEIQGRLAAHNDALARELGFMPPPPSDTPSDGLDRRGATALEKRTKHPLHRRGAP